jgi:2-methylcitrate dehydratase PrpD
MSATGELIGFLQSLGPASLPAHVIRQARRCVLDLLGVAIAGSQTEMAMASRRFALGHFGPGDLTLVASSDRLGKVGATWANGVCASALDMDDGHRLAMGHPGAAVIPTALAFAEAKQASGREFLAAVVAGYEVGVRVSVARNEHYKSHHYATGIWGAAGSLAAAGHLLNFDQEAYQNALGIAIAHSPFPPPGPIQHDGMIKEVIGWAGVVGCTAALLAQSGFAGPEDMLDRCGRYDPAQLVADLGQDYAILEAYFKPYACCRWSHPAIDAVLQLTAQHDLAPDEVNKVLVEGFQQITRLEDRAPATTVAAQYSLPFSIALALTYRRIGPSELIDTHLQDPQLLQLARKVRLSIDPELDRLFPAQTATRVTMYTERGTFSATVQYPRGNPENPLSYADLVDKFLGLTAATLGADRSQELLEAVNRLHHLDNVKELTALLIP